MPGDFKGRIWNPIALGPNPPPANGPTTPGAGTGGGWNPNIEVPDFSGLQTAPVVASVSALAVVIVIVGWIRFAF